MKSPDGQVEVVKAGYTEIRMGSPLFGRVRILGSRARTNGRRFGEAMAFSPTSRYLALEELVGLTETGGPHCRAIVFDLLTTAETVVHDQRPGFIKGFRWELDGSLTVQAAAKWCTTWRATAKAGWQKR